MGIEREAHVYLIKIQFFTIDFFIRRNLQTLRSRRHFAISYQLVVRCLFLVDMDRTDQDIYKVNGQDTAP